MYYHRECQQKICLKITHKIKVLFFYYKHSDNFHVKAYSVSDNGHLTSQCLQLLTCTDNGTVGTYCVSHCGKAVFI